jgi:trimethylamine:corrinoid methyltransferase-like protein
MQGGTYKPLTQLDMDRINEAALTALEEIGLADAPQSGIDIMVGAGAILGDDGRLRYPRALIEDMLAKANREITLNARNPKHDLHLGDKKVHYGTAGAAVHMVDVPNPQLSRIDRAGFAQRRAHCGAFRTISISCKDLWCAAIFSTIEKWTSTRYMPAPLVRKNTSAPPLLSPILSMMLWKCCI